MRALLLFIILASMLPGLPINAAEGRVVKVLPHFLDLKGRHTLSPSLYERDAHQKHLRETPAERSAIRFDVQWRTYRKGPVTLRVELRGVAEGNHPKQHVLERTEDQSVRVSHWTSLTLTGEEFKKFGEVTAWRATLWKGGQLLAEQASFLW